MVGSQLYPQCKVAHVGTVTVLFIDIDEDDIEASRGGKSSKAKRPTAVARISSSSAPAETQLRQLAWSMISLDIENKDGDYYALYELARRNEELEDINDQLEEELADAYHSLDHGDSPDDGEELEELAAQLAEQHNRNLQIEESLEKRSQSLWFAQEQVDHLKVKVTELETLSSRHRTHIGNLQRALAERKRGLVKYRNMYEYLYWEAFIVAFTAK
ncbi:hypothetical protein GGI20_001357 [Coemansia sp. BCRC 34301]|nr:hypothetical protein GGI20_001357 [Coemansia sp. BCRC 34301]